MQIGDMKIEILTRSESVRDVGQLITFQQSYQGSLDDVSQIQGGADFKKLLAQTPSPTVRRSNNYDDMLHIGNMDTHQRAQSAQREMLRLTIQTKRRYKNIAKHIVKNSDHINDIDSSCTNDESEDRKGDTSHNDQDSDVSFEIDNDEEIDAAEIEEEEWVEYIKKSTIEAIEKMENERTRCWKLTQRKMKWRLAMRIATSQTERWLTKAAEWNPELSSKYWTNRSIGRRRKRWEDDINEFLKQIEDETENLTESSNHINKNCMNTAKDRGKWTLLEQNYTKSSVTRTRSNSQDRPLRYVNGVKLNDEEIADITSHEGRISE